MSGRASRWRRARAAGAPAARSLLAGALLVAAHVTVAGCVPPSPRAATRAAPPGWEPVWADEFEGERIDLASWTAEVMPDPFNEELQYYTDRIDDDPGANARVEDGILVIEARRESYEHRRHTSARLITKGKREFLHGRFAARIRQPGEVGMWPAFWLLGADIDEVGWPRCGEIDVMEGKGRLPRWTSGAIHFGPDPEGHRFTAWQYRLPAGDESFHDAWHVFAVEWSPGRIEWLVDGERVHAVDRPEGASPAEWPFDEGHPFFLLLNLAVGGWFDEGHPPPDEMAPQRLEVDWVRVHRRAGG